MKRHQLLIGIGAILLGFAAVFWARTRDQGAGAELESPTGQRVMLRQVIERESPSPVILHFWASWCAPCAQELPDLVRFARSAPGVRVVGINLDDSWDEARKTPSGVNDLPPNWVSLRDPTKGLAEQFGSFQFPESYLLDPTTLRPLEKWVGPQKWTERMLARFTK